MVDDYIWNKWVKTGEVEFSGFKLIILDHFYKDFIWKGFMLWGHRYHLFSDCS